MSEAWVADQVSRRAIVTGGVGGIGAACARHLLADGWNVEVWDLVVPDEPVEGAHYRLVDVRDHQEVQTAAAEISRVQLLVNAAGVTGFGPAASLSAEVWANVLETNLYGPYHVAQALFDALRRGGGGVINIASITARVPGAGRVAYCTSKSGLVMLTKVLALEWAKYGIRVNSVSPGYTRTRMVRDAVAAGHLDLDRIESRTPQARMAEPEEIAGVVAALTEPRFTHITGQDLAVDGGWSANGAY